MAGNILIVDNDRDFLAHALNRISAGDHSSLFRPFFAQGVAKAKKLMQAFSFDLVLYSIKRPPPDGLEFLTFVKMHHSRTPFVAVWDFGSLEISPISSKKIKPQLPQSGRMLTAVDSILRKLGVPVDNCLFGSRLSDYLRLAALERRTCLIDVTSAGSTGRLVFVEGQLMNAKTASDEGDDAVYEMLGWDEPLLNISEYDDAGELDQNVVLSLDHNVKLWETFSFNEKSKRDGERRSVVPAGPAADDEGAGACFPIDAPDINNAAILQKEDSMALEKHFNPLKEIRGYKAAGIMNYTGEVVAYNSIDPAINLELVGATFNDIFRSAHEASKKIGLDACKETVIMTPKGTIVMACSGSDAKIHLHAIGILEADGNQALMKMQLEKLLPAVMAEI